MDPTFDREVIILEELADLEVKGVPELVDYGRTSKGYPFVIMKKCGTDLKNLLITENLNRLSLKSTVQIGLQIVDRLQAVHEAGFIHCDLKPDNILLASNDFRSLESSNLVLIDFGIA